MINKLNFFGDVWIPEGVEFNFPKWANEGVVINLEAPITNRGIPAKNKICLSSDAETFSRVFDRQPFAVCLANNHILDFGEIGFSDTLQYLEKNGILYFGAGNITNRCNNPLVVNIDETNVALMGYVCETTHPIFAEGPNSGVAPIELGIIRKDILTAKTLGAQRIVISLHWGDEEIRLPKPNDISIVKELFNLGVDLIIGHHSHCRQPVYISKNQCAFFGLGNAFFPNFEYRNSDGLVAWGHQRYWNRTTTHVSYSPRTGVINWRTLREHSGTLKNVSPIITKIPVWYKLPTEIELEGYEKQYLNVFRFAMFRLGMSRILARPKVPSITSLLSFAKQLIK